MLENAEPPSAPGQVCVSDIIYVATREGGLNLAVVIDLYSRAVVGWSVAETMHTCLVTSALRRAMATYLRTNGTLLVLERGLFLVSLDLAYLHISKRDLAVVALKHEVTFGYLGEVLHLGELASGDTFLKVVAA